MYGDKWTQKTKKFHVRAQDISNMKIGEKVEFVTLDRNLCDFLGSLKLKKGVLYDPIEIFDKSSQVVIYIHENDLQGKIKWEWYKKFIDFEFHVEYKQDHWFPLEEGKLRKKSMDEEGWNKCYDSTIDEGAKSFIGKNVRVGWRGPMIKTSDLNKVKKLFL